MKALARGIVDLVSIYVVGAATAFGWFMFGIYIYTRPLPPDSVFGAEFNQDIGTSLVAQGLIFFVTFVFAGILRSSRASKEKIEQDKDRQMLRELHQWMIEQKGKKNA